MSSELGAPMVARVAWEHRGTSYALTLVFIGAGAGRR